MSKLCICKECKQGFPKFDDLRFHFALEHPEKHKAVKTWLDDTTGESLKVLEARAKEGMLGHHG